MMTFLLAIVLQAQAPTIDDQIAKFVKGDAAAREELIKLGASAIRPLLKERDKAPEKIEDLLFEIKAQVAHPKDTPVVETLRRNAAVRFRKSAIGDAVGYIRAFCIVPVVLDRFEDKDLATKEVTVETALEPVRRALDLICRQTGLDYGFFHNAVVIGKPERLWPGGKTASALGPSAAERQDVKTPEGVAVMRQLRTIKMDLDFQDQSISDMVGYLKEFTGLGIAFGSEADASRFSIRLKGVLLLDALSLITQVRDLDFVIEGTGLLIDRREVISKKLAK